MTRIVVARARLSVAATALSPRGAVRVAQMTIQFVYFAICPTSVHSICFIGDTANPFVVSGETSGCQLSGTFPPFPLLPLTTNVSSIKN